MGYPWTWVIVTKVSMCELQTCYDCVCHWNLKFMQSIQLYWSQNTFIWYPFGLWLGTNTFSLTSCVVCYASMTCDFPGIEFILNIILHCTTIVCYLPTVLLRKYLNRSLSLSLYLPLSFTPSRSRYQFQFSIESLNILSYWFYVWARNT